MKTQTLPLLAAALLALPAAADQSAIALSGAELGAWTQDYAAATNAAAASGKPVFLDFTGSDWCGWCMLMEEKVFSKPEWKEWAATNVYLVTLDFPRDKSKVPEEFQARNRELSKAFGVRGYPTYIVLDAQGKKLGQLGADRNAKPAKFIRQLCKVLGVDPPAAASAPADPAAKKLVEDVSAALKAFEEKAEALDNPTVAQLAPLNESFLASLAAIDTNGVPDGLLASFRTFSDAFAAMAAEFGKLDQTKSLDEIGTPPESMRRAVSMMQGALGRLDEAAEACGVEDASDLLDL
jgi:thioredoxin-related protein